MTDFSKKLLPELESVENFLKTSLLITDEEELYIDALHGAFQTLSEEETRKLTAIQSRIKKEADERDRRKISEIASLENTLKDLERRLFQSRSQRHQLAMANRERSQEITSRKDQLKALETERNDSRRSFESYLSETLERIATAHGSEDSSRRRRVTKKVSSTIMAFRKRPKSQISIDQLRPLDESVSRIYDGISYVCPPF